RSIVAAKAKAHADCQQPCTKTQRVWSKKTNVHTTRVFGLANAPESPSNLCIGRSGIAVAVYIGKNCRCLKGKAGRKPVFSQGLRRVCRWFTALFAPDMIELQTHA